VASSPERHCNLQLGPLSGHHLQFVNSRLVSVLALGLVGTSTLHHDPNSVHIPESHHVLSL
jgi:hypothetical protein